MTELRSPYKGLAPFEDSDLDALLFFGRERDARVIESNLVASRLTVLYGASGVGKSSVVRAAVARAVRALPEAPAVVVWADWGDDPATSLADAVAETTALEGGSLTDVVMRAADGRDVYLILDQAEEYFVYHGADDSFERQLAEILGRPLRANVLLVVRDDALAELDRFRSHLPGVFSNVVRLGRLDRTAGEAAIVRPLERFGELAGRQVEIEPELVARVLDEVAAGRIERGLGGTGAAGTATAVAGIETPYLQLVMQRLWEEEAAVGSSVLRAATLERLGGARKIVGDNLERAMSELQPAQQEIAAAMFSHLVTPSGLKVAHRPADLAAFAGVPEADATGVLRTLHDQRILRADERGGYEIFHDVLASEVLGWRRRYEADAALDRQRRAASRRHRMLLLITAGALAAALAAVSLTVWALVERGNASEQARVAKGRELDASAIALLPTDPELGMLLATEAARLSPTPTAEDTLRSTILSSRLLQSFPVGAPVTDIAVAGGRAVAGTDAGGTHLLTAGTDGVFTAEQVGVGDGRVSQVAVSADRLASAILGGPVELAGVGPPKVSRFPAPVTSAVLTRGCGRPAGCLVVGARRDLHIVDVVTGETVRRVRLPSRIEQVVVAGVGLVAVRAADPAVRIVDLRTGAARTLRTGAPVGSIAADAERVAAGLDTGAVLVWTAEAGRVVARRAAHTGSVLALALAGEVVVSGSADGSAQVWNLDERTVIPLPGGHLNLIVAADVTRDGAYALTASLDRTAKVWSTADGRLVASLVGHRDAVRDAAFLADGRRVVTGSLDGTIGVWDAGTAPDLVPSDEPAPPPPVTEAAAPDGAVASAEDDVVRLTLPSGEAVELRGHRDRVTSVAFSADGERLVTASRDHDARTWDARTGTLLHVLRGHFGAVADARFSPDGRWVVTAGPITAGLWNARTGELVRYLRGPESPLTAAAFVADETIVTSERAGPVREAVCTDCGEIPSLLEIADARLAATGRTVSEQERERYLP